MKAIVKKWKWMKCDGKHKKNEREGIRAKMNEMEPKWMKRGESEWNGVGINEMEQKRAKMSKREQKRKRK